MGSIISNRIEIDWIYIGSNYFVIPICQMHDKNLLRELWAESFQNACYVINHILPWSGKKKSPLEILYDEKSDVNCLCVHNSCICYINVPKATRTKLDSKVKLSIFIGYGIHIKRWQCMDPKITYKVITSRDVVFDEVSYYHTIQNSVTQ